MQHSILVVDDDVPLTETLTSLLSDAGYSVLIAHTAEDGLRLALSSEPGLALLDIMVPVQGGLELCRHIRAFSDIPILFLTALGDVDHVVKGLELGADDYMVKPFRSAELLARIKAHLRRTPPQAGEAENLRFGDDEIVINLPTRRVMVNGKEIDLTPREYDLLVTLAKTPGRVCPSGDLLRRAWGMTHVKANDNIKPYIHYLRKKIEEDPAAPRWILTIRGVGYRFADG